MARVLVAALVAMIIAILSGPTFIAFLRKNEFGQHVREDGPESHRIKSGTPTMGGALILLSVLVPTILWCDPHNFFVWATQDWNSAPYAVGIFALSGFSPVLDNWPGGGRAGIHGWQDTSILGTQASHGCVRMGPADFGQLMHTIPLGTPVEISP